MEKEYAFIKNNEVVNVVIFDEPTEELLSIFKNEHNVDLIIEANYNTVTGGTYDGENFWIQQPYPSWIKNYELNQWQAPVPYPEIEDGSTKIYSWDEGSLSWVLITPEL